MVASPSTAALGRALLCCLFLLSTGCGPKKGNASPEPPPPASPAPVEELWREFRGERALEDAQKQVACGPRPAGSPALEKARSHIESALRECGWTVERQTFSQPTPHGTKTMVNLIARYPRRGSRAEAPQQPRALVASHYDTKIFSTILFVGANDGASSTGALVELGRTLALDPDLAARVDLVFFDGEEAVQQFSETDGLYGSRYFAAALRHNGEGPMYQYGIVWDMIGDKDLTITLPLDSPKVLARQVLECAETLGVRAKFGILDRSLLDDHVPLQQIARIPALDLIDFDYPAWHTADDTLQQLSAESLQTIGAVTLLHLCKTLRPTR